MRYARIVLPILLALTAAACARKQPVQYVMDPSTGQPVPVVQQYGQPAYAQPQQADSGGRGLFGSRSSAPAYSYQPQYAQQHYAQQSHAQSPDGQQSYVMQYRPPQQATGRYAGSSYAYAPAGPPYTLDAGDKLRIVVFGQAGITGDYLVEASGQVTLPLVGSVPARGYTTKALSQMIGERLKQGYVREPHVTVSIASYRPFFILGEVTTPGQYPYVPNMTAENAVAIAGGFTPRAKKGSVELTRTMGGQQVHQRVPLGYPLRPGDTVMVGERWF
jgi:polysaccharide export outer membrane protein